MSIWAIEDKSSIVKNVNKLTKDDIYAVVVPLMKAKAPFAKINQQLGVYYLIKH